MPKKFKIALGLLAFLLLAFGINGVAILAQGDEYMHIATVRQSLDNNSWLLPTLEGLPNYYKPPILFWIGMLSEALLGNSLFAVRLPAVLAGLGSIFLLYRLLKVTGAPALFPSIAYALSLGTLKFSKLLMMEQFMAFALLVTTLFFVRFVQTKSYRCLLWAGLASAIAYFFKGPLFQVYTGFLFLAWAIPLFLHFNAQGDFRGWHRVPTILKAALVLHLPLLLPLAWNGWLFYSAPDNYGKAILEFFYVNENLSKFRHADQSPFMIPMGWLLYSAPWTVMIIGAFFLALRSTVRDSRVRIGRMLFVTALAISLLHMLPSRKDPYYVIPVLPVLFAGLPMILYSSRNEIGCADRISRWMKANFVFSAFVALIAFIAALILRLPWYWVLA
ncbi:MAG: glycosyltransferase family 39 protein, partial [Leptospiraceae bacterium]|nr:glycosyltransferase family 39 protein [Leptospiraceae bacterium]